MKIKSGILTLSLIVLSLLLIGVIVFISFNNSHTLVGKDLHQPISEFGIYADSIQAQFASASNLDLFNGKQVVCFFSLKCIYCRKSMKELSRIAELYEFSERVNVLFMGREVNVNWFYNTSEAKHFPYQMMEKERLSIITSGDVPKIFLVENGVIQAILNYDEITEYTFQTFFNP